jgi:hypothetical protein
VINSEEDSVITGSAAGGRAGREDDGSERLQIGQKPTAEGPP